MANACAIALASPGFRSLSRIIGLFCQRGSLCWLIAQKLLASCRRSERGDNIVAVRPTLLEGHHERGNGTHAIVAIWLHGGLYLVPAKPSAAGVIFTTGEHLSQYVHRRSNSRTPRTQPPHSQRQIRRSFGSRLGIGVLLLSGRTVGASGATTIRRRTCRTRGRTECTGHHSERTSARTDRCGTWGRRL